MVTPAGNHQFRLDKIASNLDADLTMLNITKYANTADAFPQYEASSTHDPNVCLKKQKENTVFPPDYEQMNKGNATYTHDQYAVVWICALPVEVAAAKAMLEKVHPSLPVQPDDTNHCIFDQIGHNNIVIACLPHGVYGTTSAAMVAAHLLYSFKKIRVRLMVGIGGGVPSTRS